MEVPLAPWLPRRMSPGPSGLPGPPGGCPPEPTGTPSGGSPSPAGPPGGGSLGLPGDLESQDPPRQVFIWQGGSALDQSIVNLNRYVMQLLTAQQAANVQLQLQTQQNQAGQTAHTDALNVAREF